MCIARLDTKIHPRFSRGCKVRGESGSHHRPSRNAGFGATRRRRYGAAGGRVSGKPGKPSVGAPGSARSGATWRAASRHRRRVRDSGKPGEPPAGEPRERRRGATRGFTVGTAEGAKMRGDPRIHLWNCRKIEQPGRPGARLGGAAGRAEIRGNSELQRWWRRRMREPGKPGDSSPAQLEDEGGGETCGLVGELPGTMHGPSNLRGQWPG